MVLSVNHFGRDGWGAACRIVEERAGGKVRKTKKRGATAFASRYMRVAASSMDAWWRERRTEIEFAQL